jgi:transcriptional regulator with XRE-family HTH domain
MDERTTAFVQSLGRRLFTTRVAAGLTVRAAASAIGVDHSMIVRYENAQSIPPLERLITLADLYGITPAALLARTDAAVPLIAAIDRADAQTLAQLGRAMGDAHEPR